MLTLRMLSGAAAIAKANVTRLSGPLKINLCVTYACQYRCKTCNIWQRKPTNELTRDELLSFVEKNRDAHWLDITGGEIFLRKDILDIFDAVASTWRRLAVLHFPTNGFLTDAIVTAAERLARQSSMMTIITVSLDGDEQMNDLVRGIKGGFRRQIETFRALRKIKGIRAVLGMTLSRFNAGAYEHTLAACQREIPGLRPDEFHLNVAQTSSHYYGNAGDGIEATRDAVAGDIAAYRAHGHGAPSISSLIERTYLNHLDVFLRTRTTPMPCHALRSSCFVDPWGTVFPCITYSKPIGTLRDTAMDLAPIWKSHEASKLQSEIWRGECPQCWTACEAYQSILGNLVRPHVFAR
jgi:radical SAM protein with 4Fe4S-binding SPASM domain